MKRQLTSGELQIILKLETYLISTQLPLKLNAFRYHEQINDVAWFLPVAKRIWQQNCRQMKRLQLQMQMHQSFRIWLGSKCRATQVPLLVNAAWRSLLVVSLKYGGEGNTFEAWELHFASRNSCQLRNHRACEFYFAANFLPIQKSNVRQ